MKRFILKTCLFIALTFICFEFLSRLVIDPFYFNSINTYNLNVGDPGYMDLIKKKNTEHVDYLFIGSSRVPATINELVIMNENPDKIAIVAGRGYMTPGIHYQALVNRLAEYPNYLKDADVFIEYFGPGIFTNSFDDDKYRVYEPVVATDGSSPHLILPHLNYKSLIAFLKESKNPKSVKFNILVQYCFSSYRTISYIKEKFDRFDEKLLFENKKQELVSEGGIRNDIVELSRQKALEIAKIESQLIENGPIVSFDDLNKSSLAKLNKLITENGGKLYLYKMPLSSIQEAVFNVNKALRNKQIFENWLSLNGIKVVSNDKFKYEDDDFPDTWHLSADRRDEFTFLLYNEIIKLETTTLSGL